MTRGDDPCHVLVNSEGQYGLWPLDGPPPAGWRAVGFAGARLRCFSYVAELAGQPPSRRLGTAPLASSPTLREAWAGSVAAHPDEVALWDGPDRLTYTELDRRADALAEMLAGQGVRAEELVVLCLPPGAALVIGLLGVLKARGTYVPVDARAPASWRDAVVADCGAGLTVSPAEDPPGWLVQRLADGRSASMPSWPAAAERGAGAAAVHYSSGLQCDGVVLEHRQLFPLLADPALPGLAAGDVTAQRASVCSDLLNLEIWRPLAAGAAIAIPAGARSVPVSAARPAERGPAVRELHVRRADGQRLISLLFGAAETGAACAAVLTRARARPVLRPLSGARLYVLDAGLRPAANGEPGVLHVGGDRVARGYLDRPALTVSRFLPDPFGGDGSRMYATGVLARRLPSGEVQLLAP